MVRSCLSLSGDLDHAFSDFHLLFTDQPGCPIGVRDNNIPLMTDVPVRLKPYPFPFTMKEVMEKEVQNMLDIGGIEKSTSEYSSPIVLVKKLDGSVCFCIDFRALNKITVFDAEPIPDQEEMFAHLAKAKYFTKIDLAKGYWQIPVKPEDRHKTAFQTPQGLFQWTRMPFGLVSAPATFAWMMRTLELEQNSAISFFDDILIATEDWESHVQCLKQVLSKLQRFGLTARPSKIFAGFQELEFLCHMVGKGMRKPVDKIEKKIST